MFRPLLLLLYVSISMFFCDFTKVSGDSKKLYLSTERPVLGYRNPKYVSFVNFSTVRYGRRNPVYYVELHWTSLITLDNNVLVLFSFYEYYNSQYRRSFLDLSFKYCNLIYKDQFFGATMRKNLPKSCPHPPGTYHLYNMSATVEGIPDLPFMKGRIYCNVSLQNEQIASGHIEMELKRMRTSTRSSPS